jgi:hypothetical protein
MRPSSLLLHLVLLLSAAAISGQAVGKPKEAAPQTIECAPASGPMPQTDSKASSEEIIALAHTVVASAEAHMHVVEAIATFMGTILSFVGAKNLVDVQRNKNEMTRLDGELRILDNGKKYIEADIQRLEREKNDISIHMAGLKEQQKSLQESSEKISEDMAKLKENQGLLQETSKKALADVEELWDQGKTLRKQIVTVQKVNLAMSRLGFETRRMALNDLSQLDDPLGIDLFLEVLEDSTNHVKLRTVAAYGLGRYSKDPDSFKKYYPEIFSGFCYVLDNSETPPELASKTIESAKKFSTIPDDLTLLMRKWEQSDAPVAGPAKG